jgi:carbonic anhydrase
MKAQTKESQAKLTPKGVQQILAEGNKRFVNNKMVIRNLMNQVRDTATGQFPHSVVLSCIDSRTSSELIFDQGIGDIFNARVAGNIVNEDILGSLEYSCRVAGSKLLLVLGHTSCGAVTSACKGIELGNITALLNKIKPSIRIVESKVDNIISPESIQMVADENVRQAIKEIREKSEILSQMEKGKEIMIIGGMYNVATGEVEFFD